MRLIDADVLKEQFKDKEGDVFTAFHFYDAIDEMPTIDAVDREDVISICNILGSKMDDDGSVAVEQVRDAVKDMRPHPMRNCRDCKVSYDSEECYGCANNIQNVYRPKEDDKCEKCEHCDYYSCPKDCTAVVIKIGAEAEEEIKNYLKTIGSRTGGITQ